MGVQVDAQVVQQLVIEDRNPSPAPGALGLLNDPHATGIGPFGHAFDVHLSAGQAQIPHPQPGNLTAWQPYASGEGDQQPVDRLRLGVLGDQRANLGAGEEVPLALLATSGHPFGPVHDLARVRLDEPVLARVVQRRGQGEDRVLDRAGHYRPSSATHRSTSRLVTLSMRRAPKVGSTRSRRPRF